MTIIQICGVAITALSLVWVIVWSITWATRRDRGGIKLVAESLELIRVLPTNEPSQGHSKYIVTNSSTTDLVIRIRIINTSSREIHLHSISFSRACPSIIPTYDCIESYFIPILIWNAEDATPNNIWEQDNNTCLPECLAPHSSYIVDIPITYFFTIEHDLSRIFVPILWIQDATGNTSKLLLSRSIQQDVRRELVEYAVQRLVSLKFLLLLRGE